jgi:glutamyl-tRNA reductase
MKPYTNESYEAWAKRVAMFEHGHAMMQIAQGKDAEQVLEEMSRRIMEKLLHPIYKALKESTISTYDLEKEKASYKRNYLDKNPHGVADHVVDNDL